MFGRVAQLIVLCLFGLSSFSVMAATETRTLEERVAELEANQTLNIFSFSGTLTTRYDDILKAQQAKPASLFDPAFDNKNLSYLRMKFQFNVDANVSKYIKVYSRFTTSKNFNTFYKSGNPQSASGTAADLGEANSYASSAVYLEKAYADLTVPETNFTFSIGRLPTVDGAPQNYKDGRARLGTYPQMSFNSVFDGIGMTYAMDEYLPEKSKMAARLIYTPFSQYNISQGGYLKPPQDSGQTTDNPTQVSMGAIQLDYSVEDLSWADGLGIVIHSYQTGDLYYPLPAIASQGIAASTLYFALAGTTFSAEFAGIAHTNWDASLNYLATEAKSTGSYAGSGFLTSSATSDTNRGGIFLLSTRYRLPTWVLGFEYVNGSQDSVYFAQNDETLTDFYATRGDAYHLYVTKKFVENVSLRLGYMLQKYKWTPTSLGANIDSDREIETAYANFRLDF